MKTTKEFRSLTDAQLRERVEEFKKEQLKLKAQASSGAGLANPGRLRQVRKNIARLHTLVREREVATK